VRELYIEEREQAKDPERLKTLSDVSAIFFSGGDQLRITSQIGDTPIYSRIHEIFQNGGVIAGTSAGASVMSETMLVRGENASSRIGELAMAPGLGLLSNVIIDQHFAERGRIGRLIAAVAQNPRVLGVGIDEDTAIIVEEKKFRVIGSGAVYLVDASTVTRSNLAEDSPDSILSVYDLKVHVLSSGDIFDLEGRRPMHMDGNSE